MQGYAALIDNQILRTKQINLSKIVQNKQTTNTNNDYYLLFAY